MLKKNKRYLVLIYFLCLFFGIFNNAFAAKKLEMLIKPSYSMVSNFNKYGYAIVIDKGREQVGLKSSGLNEYTVKVYEPGKTIIINKKGKIIKKLNNYKLTGSKKINDKVFYSLETLDGKTDVSGVINKSGEFIQKKIPPQDSKEEKPKNDLFLATEIFETIECLISDPCGAPDCPETSGSVEKKDIYKYGYKNKSNKWVVEPKFIGAYEFNNGLAAVGEEIGGRSHIIDAQPFGGEGFSMEECGQSFPYPKNWGYIDKKGKYVIEPRFLYALPFNSDVAFIADGKFVESKLVRFPYVFTYHTYQSKEDYDIKYYGGNHHLAEAKWGLIDKKGDYLIKPKYIVVSDFKDGMAKVAIGKIKDIISNEIDLQWGAVNNKGKEIIPPKYLEVAFVGEGLIAVNTGRKGWAYYNQSGKCVIKPNGFYGTQSFREGLAAGLIVEGNDVKFCYINKKGKRVIQLNKENKKENINIYTVSDFENGFAKVHYSGEEGLRLIDKSGKFIFSERFYKFEKLDEETYSFQGFEVELWGYIQVVDK